MAAFAAAISVVYLPSVVFVYGVMADAEQIFFKSDGFASPESAHLARIARPIAAAFANFPTYFLHQLSDFRFARIFSLVTIIFCGSAITWVMIRRLWIRPTIAFIAVFGIFCLPGFIFSVMNPSAWPLHLLSVVFAVSAYMAFARSHACSLFLSTSARALDGRGMLGGFFPAGHRGSVSLAVVLLVASFFTYPPNSALILVFPVVIVLFSALPERCRESLLLRDLGFMCVGMLLFVLISKLVYYPVGIFLRLIDVELESGPNAIYRFVFDFNPVNILSRFFESLRVAKDLWFLPNFNGLILTGYAALALLLVPRLVDSARTKAGMMATAALGIFVCYVLSVAAQIFSVGGLISYRTVVVPSAIIMLTVIWGASRVYESLTAAIRTSRFLPRSEWPFILPLFVAIFWSTSYGICTVIQIGQNELLYVGSAIREANTNGADGILIVDGRRMISPHELPRAEDIHGHALLPYELGCFSTYCIGAPGIYFVAKIEAQISNDMTDVMIARHESLKGVTCSELRRNVLQFGSVRGWDSRHRWEVELAEFVSQHRQLECREYDTLWLDLEWHPAAGFLKSRARIDRSIWSFLLP